ncbi:MAG TPA: DUF2497 domain-containing protein, partial [Vineibacter sp.]|nr:DUF2497 domain-containing protein [Vineibacter sp.]
MADSKPQQDPSMDDILSSIRRIIQADEGRVPDATAKAAAGSVPANGPSPQAASPMQRADDVLLLTDLVDDPDAARASAPPPAAPVRPLASNPISSAMDRLARAVEAASPPVAPAAEPPPAAGSSGATLEDVVKDALRPMLQEWIDKNLPALVERIVER